MTTRRIVQIRRPQGAALHGLTGSQGQRASTRAHRCGFSLVETTISIILVGGLLISAVGTLGSAVRARQIRAERSKATLVAQQLITEVLQAAYKESELGGTVKEKAGNVAVALPVLETPEPDNFGPETGEADGSRTYFDDIDDYDDWSASPPQEWDGTVLTEYTGWTRQVSVTYADQFTLIPTGTVTDTGLKLITVTVTDPEDEQTTVSALRSNLSTYDQVPPTVKKLVSWVTVTLQIGDSAAAEMKAGVNLLNQPESKN